MLGIRITGYYSGYLLEDYLMLSRLLFLVAFAAILTVPTSASAQGTYTWNFGTIAGGPNAAASSSTGSGAAAGSFSVVNSFGTSAITTLNGLAGFNLTPSAAYNYGTSVNDNFTTFSTAAPYYQVTLTDSGTNGIQLTNFTFYFRHDTTGADRYTLRASSVNNYGTDLLSATVGNTDAWLTQANGTGTVNLGTGTTTLRLYVFNGTSGAVSNLINTQIDDVVISYSPVPEPATMLGLSALGLGAIGLVRRLRRGALTVS